MTNNEIVRTWKDEDYRLGLGKEELAFVPPHPAGIIELTDEDLAGVEGAETLIICISLASASVSFVASLIITALTHR